MPELLMDAVVERPEPVPVQPLAPRPARRRRVALPTGSDALLFIAVLGIATGLLGSLAGAYSVDSWLELVAGRDIVHAGLPHVETLTVMAHGSRWIDQQWLAQLIAYAIDRFGGLGLLGVVNVALMASAIGAAIASARRSGARPWIILLMAVLCLWQIVPSREVRTQAFAMPLLVATLTLLSADSRSASRRVYWCLPILVLWANLHGTVTIGAGLVALHGLTQAWQRRATLRGTFHRSVAGTARAWRRPLALIVGAPLALFVTPYGLGALPYYRSTLGNSALKHAVTEWQPITSVWIEAVPFFALAGLAIWCMGRRPERTTGWEKLVLLILAAGSIDAIRNSMLFGFAALMFLPGVLETIIPRRSGREAPVRTRLNRVLCIAVIAVFGLGCATTVLRPDRTFEHSYQREGVLAAVRSATRVDPSIHVLTDVRFADWLLWRDPGLRGRIASDARWEILPASAINSMENVFATVGTNWKAGAAGYRLLVLDRTAEPETVKGFLSEPGRRVLYDDGTRLVIERRAA